MMITEHQLRDLLREELDRQGDGSNLLLSDVLADGVRRRRTSMMRRAGGAVTALAVGAGGAFVLATTPAAAATWALAPAPEHVNQRIVELVEEQLPAGAAVDDIALKAYATPEPGQGAPEPGGVPLPRDQWSDADAWLASISLDTGTTIRVSLGHAKGETEGDPAANCVEVVESDAYSVCDVDSVTRQGQDVVVEWREGAADLAKDGMLYEPGLIDGPDYASYEATPVSTRELGAQPGGDFLISIIEITPEGGAPTLDRDAMADIALDAELLDAR